MALTASLPALRARAATQRYDAVYRDGAGIALRGYDPVAYFLHNEALRGDYDNQAEVDGVPWYFVSQSNRDKFVNDPEAFMPEFGGFCAEAMSRGFKRSSDPELWVKVDSKIYLHYSVEVQNLWATDIRGYIAKAEQHWPEVRDT